jgi:hypothetical protein
MSPFETWFENQVDPNDEDYPSPEAIGFARAAWDAGAAANGELDTTILRDRLAKKMATAILKAKGFPGVVQFDPKELEEVIRFTVDTYAKAVKDFGGKP